MKNLLIILFACTLIFSCKDDKPQLTDRYEIRGTIKGMPNGLRVYLKSNINVKSKKILDTAVIKNEEFLFKGIVSNPLSVGIFVNSISGNLPIILENGITTVIIDKNNIRNSEVSGTKNNDLLVDFLSQRKEFAKQKIELDNKLKSINKTDNQEQYNSSLNEIKKINQSSRNHSFEFAKKYPNSYISLMAISLETENSKLGLAKFKESMIILDEVANLNAENKKIAKKINDYIKQREAQSNLEIGKIAPKFSAPDTDGKLIALDDIKGKVTIIDFWAAWCGPCRRENPNVVKIYEKYHDKGLEIIGVSLDGNRRQKDPKAAWLKAIKDDNLTWNHVSSLKYFNDPVAKLYNVQAIPRTYIIDENGVIVAKNLRGQALENKIAELLN